MLIRIGSDAAGFAMAALDSDDGNQWIYRFMIDQRFQGQGYGAKALDLLIGQIFEETGCPRIMLGVKPDNTTAIALYQRAGFRPAGSSSMAKSPSASIDAGFSPLSTGAPVVSNLGKCLASRKWSR